MLMAEHSMCQPGRPSPISVDQLGSPVAGTLPEREVAHVVLAVLVGLDALPDPLLRRVEVRQRAVRGPATRCGRRSSRRRCGRRGPARGACAMSAAISGMWSVARGSTSGMATRSRRRSARNVCGVARGQLADGDALRAAASRMILSSTSVMFMTQRDRVALPGQVAAGQVGEQEAPEVADVGRRVDGRAAAVHAHVRRRRAARTARARHPGCCGSWSVMRATTPTSAVALMVRPAPSSPDRLPRRRLDRDARRVDAQELREDGRASARAARHRAGDGRPGWSGPARPGRQAGQPPAARRPGAAARGCRCRGSPRRPAGKRRPRSPSRGRGQQPVADRVERHVAVGVTVQPGRLGDLDAAQAQAVEAAEGMAVGAPARTRAAGVDRRHGPAPGPASRSAGSVDLEVGRLAGHGDHRHAVARQQLLPRRRTAPARPRRRRWPPAAGPRRAPCGVCARNSADRSAVPATMRPSRDPLERIDDRQHRDRGTVRRRPPRRPASTSAGRRERPGRVVDQDHLRVRGAHAARHASPVAARHPPRPRRRASRSHGSARSSATRSAAVDHDDRAGRRAAPRIASTAQRSAGRPPIGRLRLVDRRPCGCWNRRRR